MPPSDHTLISFLGRSQLDSVSGYRPATYRFADGSQSTTPYFGLALSGYLKPTGVVLLGTTGSMWDLLVEHVAESNEHEEARLALIDAVRANAVDQSLIDRIEPILTRRFGVQVAPRLIADARDEAGQRAILATIEAAVHHGQVSFDVTHGYRHLGMIGLVSAFMLQGVGRHQLAGIYYGALDMTDSCGTPVLRLDGLNAIQHWVAALERFAASGDYGVFAPLLASDGLANGKADCLAAAAHLERIGNVADAAKQLRSLLAALAQWQPTGASALFIDKLKRYLRWAEEKELHEQQRLLALQAHARGDYLRAAIFGLESMITRLCKQQGEDPLDYGVRSRIDQAFQKSLQADATPDWRRDAYWLVKNLRNAMAHGTPPGNPKHGKLLGNPKQLRETLQATLSRLTNT